MSDTANLTEKLVRMADWYKEQARYYMDRAEKAERERDEAIRQRDETNQSSKYAVEYAERERDEAGKVGEAFMALAWNLEGERNKLRRERDEARELVQEMSESNQVILADLRHYREEWKKLKGGAK
jgi:hypothetical protein